MAGTQRETVICQICKQEKKITEVLPGELIRPSVAETIRKKHPDWSSGDFICLADLNHFRAEYVEDVLEEERGGAFDPGAIGGRPGSGSLTAPGG